MLKVKLLQVESGESASGIPATKVAMTEPAAAGPHLTNPGAAAPIGIAAVRDAMLSGPTENEIVVHEMLLQGKIC